MSATSHPSKVDENRRAFATSLTTLTIICSTKTVSNPVFTLFKLLLVTLYNGSSYPTLHPFPWILPTHAVENVSLVLSFGPSALSALIVALNAPQLPATVYDMHQY